ncbi:MAG: tyrosine-type recombinase/integrase [Clostridiales bacterium]|nr:tyrosine-type recombinase/integrase [Clostridiales bacterium]
MAKKSLCLTVTLIQRYAGHLCDQERSAATIQKYVHDLTALSTFLDGRPMTKGLLLEWKEGLIGRYAPASVNAMLAAVNRFLTFLGRNDLRLRPLKIQRALFLPADKELTRAEYIRLVRAAQSRDNQRLALVLQTICATGIRVSELRFITAEAVQTGRAEVVNKGKRRAVFLPEKLRRLLKGYLRAQKITAGAVFLSRRGNPLDRSNIWRDMKALCQRAGVAPGKVFPHNLRHLFARTYYALEKDLSRLADILGHSNVTTTRIYTAESGAVHARQIGRLNLVVT